MEIGKLATTVDLTCRIYVVSDGVVNFVNYATCKASHTRLTTVVYMETPFNIIIVGMTACGKTHYLLKCWEGGLYEGL